MLEPRDALEIADDLLYRTGKGLLSGDFDSFAPCFALPYLIETAYSQRPVKTIEDIRTLFDDVREHYRTLDVRDLARTVVSAEVLSDKSIGSTHVSRLLGHDGEPINVPYPTYSIIREFDGAWKIISSIYAVLNDPALSNLLAPATVQKPRN